MDRKFPIEIDVQETATLLASQATSTSASVLLVDCREPAEYEICHIEKAELIPMQEIPQKMGAREDWQERHVIVYCHHGIRSRRVVEWLRRQGFPQAQSMAGGIEAWSQQIDPSIPRY